MPDWNAGAGGVNVSNERAVSVRMQYAGGYSFSVQLGNGLLGGADYSLGEISAFRASLGAASNFGVSEMKETLIDRVAPQNVVAYDDAYGANVTANLRFVNNSNEQFTVTIPAPLKRLFAGNGINLVAPDIAADPGTGPRILAELIRDLENLVNNSFAPANSYSFAGGERARRAMKPSPRPDNIELTEPADDTVQP